MDDECREGLLFCRGSNVAVPGWSHRGLAPMRTLPARYPHATVVGRDCP